MALPLHPDREGGWRNSPLVDSKCEENDKKYVKNLHKRVKRVYCKDDSLGPQLDRRDYGIMRRFFSILLAVLLAVHGGFIISAVAEEDFTILYAIPSDPNPYEQTFNTFTLSYCYPAQLLTQPPTITNCKEDPNGLSWCIFAFEHGEVQLTGKNYLGIWECATWSNVEPSKMLFVCYCLCKAWDKVYDNTDFAICLYSDSGDHSYISNKASADSYIEMIDNTFGDTADQEHPENKSNIIARGTNDPILALFPGIAWGMKKDEMIRKYSSDMIIDISDEDTTECVSMADIYGEKVFIMFGYEDEKLDMIYAIYSQEKTDLYLTDMTKDYGKPVRTLSFFEFMDELIEVENGDVAMWRTENSNITIELLDAGSVTYRPL